MKDARRRRTCTELTDLRRAYTDTCVWLCIYVVDCTCVACARSVVSDSLRPFRLQPTRPLCPRDFPGKNPGGGCHFLLQGIFPTQGSLDPPPHSLVATVPFIILLCLSPQPTPSLCINLHRYLGAVSENKSHLSCPHPRCKSLLRAGCFRGLRAILSSVWTLTLEEFSSFLRGR